jgi:hypothetical protein
MGKHITGVMYLGLALSTPAAFALAPQGRNVSSRRWNLRMTSTPNRPTPLTG